MSFNDVMQIMLPAQHGVRSICIAFFFQNASFLDLTPELPELFSPLGICGGQRDAKISVIADTSVSRSIRFIDYRIGEFTSWGNR